MAINLSYIEEVLKNKFTDADIELLDEKGDGYHLALYITSDQFKGVTPVKRHQLIYDALGSLMNDIHALSIKAVTKNKD
ncbi:BolA/IbaG family iron-sulfur metabolism protein [Rickettsiales bacterium LUAb2]